MTGETIELYKKLDNQIKIKALNIAIEIHKIWPQKYQFNGTHLDDIEEFNFEELNGYESLNITCSKSFFGDLETYYSDFPIDWLTMDIEDIKSIVENEKQEEQRRIEEAKELVKKTEKERREKEEYEYYLELKKKFDE